MSEEGSAVATEVAPDREVVTAPAVTAVSDNRVAALEAELGKWRQRVPKLAAALKARTEELETLRAQSSQRADAPSGGAGLKARDELIAELEAKLKKLNEREKQAQAALHSQQLAAQELAEDVESWRGKWQSVTGSLDEQVASTDAAQKALREAQRRIDQATQQISEISAERNSAREQAATLESAQQESERSEQALRKELEAKATALKEQGAELERRQSSYERLEADFNALQTRNDKLLETTELANTQIEALGESLAALKGRLTERETALVDLGEAHEEQTRLTQKLRDDLARRGDEVDALRSSAAAAQFEHGEALDQQQARAAAAEDRLAAAQSEIRQLKDLVASQTQAIEAADQAQRELKQTSQQVEAQLKAELDASIEARQSALAGAAETAQQDLVALEQRLTAVQDTLLAQQQLAFETELARLDQDAADLRATSAQDRERAADALARAHSEADARIVEEVATALLAAEQRIAIEVARTQAAADDQFAKETAKAEAVADQRIRDLERSLEQARRLKDEQRSAQASLDDALEAATQEQLRLSNECDALRQLLQAARAEADAEPERHAAALAAQDDAVRQEYQAPMAELAEFKASFAMAEQAVGQHADQREQLTSRVAELEEALRYAGQDRDAYEALKVEHQQTLVDHSKLCAELAELSEALDQAQQRMADEPSPEAVVPEAQASASDADGSVGTDAPGLEARIQTAALEAQLAELDEVVRERDAYMVSIMSLEDEVQALKRTLRDSAASPESAVPDEPAAGASPDSAESEVRRLEALVRERTEEANDLRWQLSMKEAADTDGASHSSDDKMLLVLNQQLQRAQQENQRLAGELRALGDCGFARVESDRAANDEGLDDDLSQIRGIGDKLVAQLANLGFSRFEQIAELKLEALEDAEHPLHPHRSRIERDEWVEQAQALLAGR